MNPLANLRRAFAWLAPAKPPTPNVEAPPVPDALAIANVKRQLERDLRGKGIVRYAAVLEASRQYAETNKHK